MDEPTRGLKKLVIDISNDYCTDDPSTTVRKEGFDLSRLSDFVDDILSSTESVKGILERECNEARYVLRACPIEIIVTKEINETCCTCESKASLENHAKEIVEGIGRALAQAQELREKIAINNSKQKRKTREPDTMTIYMPDKKVVAKKPKQGLGEQRKSTKSLEPENKSVARSTNKPIVGLSRGDSSSTDAQKCPVVAGNESEFKSKTVARKKLLRLSAENAIGSRSTDGVKRTKNFVAANRSNIKNLQRNSKSTADLTHGFSANFMKSRQTSHLSPLTGTSETLSGCSTSIAELNNLMSKVSVEATRGSSTSCIRSKDSDCPCHGTDARKVVKQRVRSTVDLMEGLDRFGVPGYLVRLLKIYHLYTSKEFTSDCITDKRRERAANRFLMEFDGMNEDRIAKRRTTYLALADLTVGFQSLFRELYDNSSSVPEIINVTDVTSRYFELDYRSKTCQLRKFDPAKFRKSKTSVTSKKYRTRSRGWLANGVWNRAGPDSFPSMTRTHCIRYANREQLLSFFELNQRLQLLHYHRNMMDLLIDKVLPNILENFDHDSAEYCDAYKMIFTIAQVLNPRIPVLVRTDV